MHGAISTQQKPLIPFLDPTSLSGLQSWYDAADLLTIIDGGGGGVFGWQDKSANVRTLSQLTGANQPHFGTRTLNGKNVIDFDGTNDRLLTDPVTINGPFTFFVVVQNDDGADSTQQVILDRADSTSGPAIQKVTANKWELYAGAGLQAGTADTSAHYITAVMNGTSSQLSIDGVGVTGNAGSQSLNGIRIGNAAFNNALFWDGIIGEVIIYDRVLTVQEIAQVEGYLMVKWLPPITTISGLQAWWDASDAASITSSAGMVTQWNDKSGNANHVVEPTNGPLIGSTTQKGRNTLLFDGVNDRLRHINGAVTTVTDFLHKTASTAFVIAKNAGGGNSLAVFATSDEDNWGIGYWLGTAQGSTRISHGVSAGSPLQVSLNTNASYVWDSTWHLVSVLSDPTNVTVAARSTAAVDRNASYSNNVATNTPSASASFGRFCIGSRGGGAARYWKGEIAEIIIYNRLLTAPEIAKVETYLQAKWI